jgi:hypothetical protein
MAPRHDPRLFPLVLLTAAAVAAGAFIALPDVPATAAAFVSLALPAHPTDRLFSPTGQYLAVVGPTSLLYAVVFLLAVLSTHRGPGRPSTGDLDRLAAVKRSGTMAYRPLPRCGRHPAPVLPASDPPMQAEGVLNRLIRLRNDGPMGRGLHRE